MQIIRLLRSCYDGDEHLVLWDDSYKRSKQINPDAVGSFPDRLASRLHFLSKIGRIFLEPDFIDLNGTSPLFMFPYHGEKEGQEIISDHHICIEIAQCLVHAFESLHHISSDGFGVWGLQNLLYSDKLRLMPPLWVNLSATSLQKLASVPGLYVAPELLSGKTPTSQSDTYVLGKILQRILPEEQKASLSNVLLEMTHENPHMRPSHFSRLFQRKTMHTAPKVQSAANSSHTFQYTVDRSVEMSQLLNWINLHTGPFMTSVFIHGHMHVGKKEFLSSMSNELRNMDWRTIKSTSASSFLKELMQLAENPELVGLTLEELELIWKADRSIEMPRMLEIVQKMLVIIPRTAIMIPDFDRADPTLLLLIQGLRRSLTNTQLLLLATGRKLPSDCTFDMIFHLHPLDFAKTSAVLESIFGKRFLQEHSEFLNWVFHVSGGFPNNLFNLLQLLYNSGTIILQKGKWLLNGSLTSVPGFSQYLDETLGGLSQDVYEFLSLLSCLSPSFLHDDLVALSHAAKIPQETCVSLFQEIENMGLVFACNETEYLFSLDEIWLKAYNRIHPNRRHTLHQRLANFAQSPEKKAWHFGKLGEPKRAAAFYWIASRKAFFKSKNTQKALELLNYGMDLLGKESTPLSFKAYEAFLLYQQGKSVPEHTVDELKKDPRFMPIVLCIWNQQQENQKVIDTYHAFINQAAGRKAPSPFLRMRFEFEYATALRECNRIDDALLIIHKILKETENRHGFFIWELRTRCYCLLIDIHHRNNQYSQGYSTMETAISLAEHFGFFYLLPQIYSIAGQFLFVFNPMESHRLLEKAVAISDRHLSLYRASEPLHQMAYYALYMGDNTRMFEHLDRIREIGKVFLDAEVLADTYILESYFHTYNKQPQQALEDIRKAQEISQAAKIQKRIARGTCIVHIMNHQWEELDEYLKGFEPDYKWEYGFDEALAIYHAKTPQEVQESFRRFRINNKLWLEEMALGYCDKLSKMAPEEFESFLQKLILDLTKDRLTLSMSIVYEAMAHHYRQHGMGMKSKKAFKKALEIYKKSGLNEAAKKLSIDFQGKEEYIEEDFFFLSSIVGSISDANNPAFTITKRLEQAYYSQRMELEVLHEIINFSKTINSTAHVPDLLDEFASWLATMVPFRQGIIMVQEKNHIVYHGSCLVEKDEVSTLIEKAKGLPVLSQKSPFMIKNEFFLDEHMKVVLFFTNPSLSITTSDFERIVLLIEELEPILSMAIRNSMSYRSSILDPLTRLYTRWFYHQRLDEEFEKAHRYGFPLAVIMSDIDHFKEVNDTYGHSKGDDVLRTIAKLFHKVCRKVDVIGRYGGEEFIILLPNTTSDNAVLLAERIRQEIEAISEFPFKITMSFGVASTEEKNYDSPLSMIESADLALYESKNHGRNRVTTAWQKEASTRTHSE